MVNQVPKCLKWERQEDVLKYSRKDLNNNGFGGFFAIVGSNKKVTSLPEKPNDASRPWVLVQ